MLQKETDTRRALDIMETLPPEIRNRIFCLIEDAALFVTARDYHNTAAAATQPTTATP